MAGRSVVAYHQEGCPTTLPRMRPMREVGPTHGTSTNSTPADATLRTIPEMGARFRRPIHFGYDTHRNPVYPRGYGLLYKVGGAQAPEGQYGGLDSQTPIRTHLVPFWVPHQAD